MTDSTNFISWQSGLTPEEIAKAKQDAWDEFQADEAVLQAAEESENVAVTVDPETVCSGCHQSKSDVRYRTDAYGVEMFGDNSSKLLCDSCEYEFGQDV